MEDSMQVFNEELTVHPYADCYPMISGEAWCRFCESIMESKGPLQKIVVWKDQERNTTWLIDGRNRLKACQDLRIEIKEAIYKDFQDDDEVRTFINGINEQRRHMTKQQRTAVALEMMEVQKELGQKIKQNNLKHSGSIDLINLSNRSSHDSRKIVAEELDLKVSEIQKAKIIQDRGTKETFEAYKQGLASTNALRLISDLPEEEQVEIVNKGKKAIKEKASEIRAIQKKEKLEAIEPSKRPTQDLGYQIIKGTHHSTMVIDCAVMTIDGRKRMKIQVDQEYCNKIIALLRQSDWFNG
jgi:ParB-like chromosome segregation protein Spo0J